ncbi:restriction endonuclease subunit S [Idiomarina abyssalis]|uniref:restriction endonuclease subunit S n=1 Tax=Idiomarina abyssalis TaxID=86102 RepID=UPI003A911F9E
MRLLKEEETPVNWNSNRIGYYVEKHKGGAPLKPADFSSSGFPVIPKKAIKSGNRLLITNPTYCTIEFAKSNTRSIVDSSYTITTLRDLVPTGPTIGTVVNYTSDEEYVLSQGVYGLKLINSLDKVYFAYLSNSSHYRKVMRRLMVGSTQVHIRTPEYLNLEIQVPPLAEQKKIAQILSTWDKAITTTDRLLSNSQQQKKALMQKLLTGKKRLLDENGVRFSGEWSSTTIQNLFARVTTKNQGQSENVVTISGQQGLINQKEFFNKSVASEILDNYTLLRRGQFAYNKSYSNGYPMGAIKRLNRYEMAVVTTLYICFEIQSEKKADSNFWEQYFESGLLNQGLSQVAHEGGRAHGLLNVKPADFFGLKIPLPSIEEQAAIGQVLAHADKNVFVLKARVEFLKKEKKALMQQLLTGKRRVKADEEAA